VSKQPHKPRAATCAAGLAVGLLVTGFVADATGSPGRADGVRMMVNSASPTTGPTTTGRVGAPNAAGPPPAQTAGPGGVANPTASAPTEAPAATSTSVNTAPTATVTTTATPSVSPVTTQKGPFGANGSYSVGGAGATSTQSPDPSVPATPMASPTLTVTPWGGQSGSH
jgi:hypothetical protein